APQLPAIADDEGAKKSPPPLAATHSVSTMRSTVSLAEATHCRWPLSRSERRLGSGLRAGRKHGHSEARGLASSRARAPAWRRCWLRVVAVLANDDAASSQRRQGA